MEKQKTIQEAISEMLLEILLWIAMTFFVCVVCLLVDPKIEMQHVLYTVAGWYYDVRSFIN